MTKVLTLLSNPENPTLNEEIRNKYSAMLNSSKNLWLNEAVALDIIFDGDLGQEAIESLTSDPFDYAVQDIATRRKKLLLADMDSTIIQCECIDELADFLGIKEKVSHITEAAMRGEIDFKAALRERVALLKGLKVADLGKVFDERVKLTPGAETLVKTMNANGGSSTRLMAQPISCTASPSFAFLSLWNRRAKSSPGSFTTPYVMNFSMLKKVRGRF